MTKKHFKAIADILNRSRTELKLLFYTEEEKKAINHFIKTVVIKELILYFDEINENFDIEKFQSAVSYFKNDSL